jgi:hypothetical protein
MTLSHFFFIYQSRSLPLLNVHTGPSIYAEPNKPRHPTVDPYMEIKDRNVVSSPLRLLLSYAKAQIVRLLSTMSPRTSYLALLAFLIRYFMSCFRKTRALLSQPV